MFIQPECSSLLPSLYFPESQSWMCTFIYLQTIPDFFASSGNIDIPRTTQGTEHIVIPHNKIV